MTDDVRDVVATLKDLLDQERIALRNGRHDVLLRLMTAKEEALTRLRNASRPSPEDLVALHAGMTRNQALVESALEGVRSASEKLTRNRDARARSVTYDELGSRTSLVTVPARRVERRA